MWQRQIVNTVSQLTGVFKQNLSQTFNLIVNYVLILLIYLYITPSNSAYTYIYVYGYTYGDGHNHTKVLL